MPKPTHLRYVFALQDAILSRQPTHDKAMATVIKVSRMTLWEWKQDLAFVAWFEGVMSAMSRNNWPLIIEKHEQLAMQGSVKSFDILARLRTVGLRNGGFGRDEGGLDANGDITNNYSIVCLIPRPPALEGAA